MTQNKKVLKTKAGAKNNDIELTDAIISKADDGGLVTVTLKDNTCSFFIDTKDAHIFISFAHDQEIKIIAYQDENETEIKKLKFESVTKNKILKIKLNKLLDGVQIKNRE